MITHDKLYRALGMNTPERFKAIRRYKKDKFVFPKNSIWHHTNVTETPFKDELFSKIASAYVEPVSDFVVVSEKAIEKTVLRNELFKRLLEESADLDGVKLLKKSIALVRDIKTTIVETYGSFDKKYIFQKTAKEQYLKTLSLAKSILANAENIAGYSERGQYISIDITAESIQSVSKYKIASEKELTTSMYSGYTDVAQCFMLELMKLSIGRDNIFSSISSTAMSKINFIIRAKEAESLLNLGMFVRMLDTGAEDSTGTVKPKVARATLIKMMLVLTSDIEDIDSDQTVSDSDDEITDIDDTDDNDSEELDDDKIHNDLETLEKISRLKKSEESIDIEESDDYNPSKENSIDRTRDHAKTLLDNKVISFSEYEKYVAKADNFDKIPAPVGTGTLKEYLDYGYEDLLLKEPVKMKDSEFILNKQLLDCTLKSFDSEYIKKFLLKDSIRFATSVTNASVIVNGVSVEEKEDIANKYTQVSLDVTLVPGGNQTITYPIPTFDEKGVAMIGGVKYYLKKQDGEMPIRKTKKNQVSLTSYYGKLFVDRSDSVAYNYNIFLTKNIIRKGIDDEDGTITDVKVGNVFYKHVPLPRTYTAISEKIVSLQLNTPSLRGFLQFDYQSIEKDFGEEAMKAAEVVKGVVVGKSGSRFICIGADDYLYSVSNRTPTPIGSVESILGLNDKSAPLEYATVNIFGKPVPVAFLLGYKLGLGSLCRLLKVTPRIVKAGGQLDMQDGDYRLRFKNESWIFNRKDKVAALILGGFVKYEKHVARYNSSIFKHQEVYSLLLDDIGLGKRHYVEIKVIYDLFIDHITKELLIEMKEPTDVVGLYVRACELLVSDEYPDEGDGRFMRIKGYERAAAAVYVEMVKSVRSMYSKVRSKRSRLDFNPMGVKMHILTDSAKEVYDEINPIHALKQQETVTLTGHGGRSSDAVTRNIKGFHITDSGIKSESNVDSGNVGVVTYLSANPKLKSLRGVRGTYVKGDSVSSLVSTTYLAQPAMDRDDMKRAVFAAIQNSHVIPCVGYEVMPLITDYNNLLGQRTDDLFSYTAEQDGVVTKKNDRLIQITYKDGTVKTVTLGTRYGKSKGEIIPHNIVTHLNQGDKVKYGDSVTLNDNFFVIDPLVGLTMKTAGVAYTQFADDKDTFEDSLGISSEFCKKMVSRHAVVRNATVMFDKSIRSIASIGDVVNTETPLLIIEDHTTERSGLMSDEAIGILEEHSRNAPKAHHHGKIEKIEIRYRGEIDDMSQSLQEFAHSLDRSLSRDRREAGLSVITNRVDESYRVDGNALEKNQAVIIFTIGADVPVGTGDKFILGNQMKATSSRVMNTLIADEFGRNIDMKMAVNSYENRMVESLKTMGFYAECVFLVQDKMIEMLTED